MNTVVALPYVWVVTETIRAISRSQLDVKSYDDCIRHSKEGRLYAKSWYLDALCDDWYALVLGRYDAVMPLPIRKKWGLSYVYQPPMTQQLGVFGFAGVDHKAFYKIALRRHLHVDYTYHGPNMLAIGQERINLKLAVDLSMNDVLNNMSTNRKRDLKKAEKHDLKITRLEPTKFLTLITSELTSSDLPTLKQIKNLLLSDKTDGDMVAYGVTDGGVEIFSLLVGFHGDRLYYLFPFDVTEKAKTCGAATFAIIELIKKYKNQIRYVDFEGSMVEGVRRFYESFNAEVEPYYHIKKSVFQFLRHAR